jgi:hypothetical protein
MPKHVYLAGPSRPVTLADITGDIPLRPAIPPSDRLPYVQSVPVREGWLYRWRIADTRTGEDAATGRRLSKRGAENRQHRVLTRLVVEYRGGES